MEPAVALSFPAWKNQSLPSPLGPDEVHVWLTQVALPGAQIHELRAYLSPEEQVAERRFHFQRDQHAFVACRGILRRLLAYYLACLPDQILIVSGEFGKPGIEGGDLQFNVSHSNGLALLGFCWNRPVGVDVEKMDPNMEIDTLAERSFSIEEQRQFRALPEPEKLQGFYNCWSRKEAFIKATGRGLNLPLDEFDVSLKPGEPARLISLHGSRKQAAEWTLHNLPVIPGFAKSLATPSSCQKLSCFYYRASR